MSAAIFIGAHFGHWYISLPIFMGPVVLVIAWLKLGDWRARRKGGEKSRAERPD